MTVTSLTALLSFSDFGLGNGLMNAISHCKAKADIAGLRANVATAYVLLTAIAVVLGLIAVMVAPSANWAQALAVDAQVLSARELGLTMTAFILCIALSIPASVIQKVQLALQLGYIASGWQLFASIVGLLCLLVAVWAKASLAWLVLAALGAPNLVYLASAILFWRGQGREFRPRLRDAKLRYADALARSGALFFLIQLAGAAAYFSDPLIIAHLLGANAVAQYSVTARLFEGIVMVGALFLTPLWPAYADAYARRDGAWIRRTLTYSLAGTAVITGILSFLLVAFSQSVMHLWVGAQVGYSLALFVLCAVWATVKASGNALAMFLNGVGRIGFQAIVATVFAVVAVAAKILLVGRMGVVGVPVALAASYLVVVALPFACRMSAIWDEVDR